jgi:NAD(P)-dependent dehydrogenase (short-subunit alcohol dehydrogenase family)
VEVSGSALVTGASRGIGRAVATELSARGFETVAGMRNTADGSLLEKEGLSVSRVDVRDPGSVELPRDLRVLVNNAGIDSEYLPVEHTELDDWREVFETNVVGLVAMTKAAIPVLRANAPAVVCNISSSSILASIPFYSVYRASKAAVSSFGETLRVELAPFGIRVVEIMPGPIDTDMFRDSAGEPAAARYEEYKKMAQRATELRREAADPMVADPADAARTIVDAILDDTGPLRHGCDPLSVGFLEMWRQSDDESMYRMIAEPLLGQ